MKRILLLFPNAWDEVQFAHGRALTYTWAGDIEVRPAERLTYTWTGARADERPRTLVTARFSDTPDGGAALDLSRGVFHSDADRTMHEQGWFGCLTGPGHLAEPDAS